MPRYRLAGLLPLALLLAGSAASAHAAEAAHVDAPGAQMDFGDLMHYFVSIGEPSRQMVAKAIAIRLGDAAICYDMETMRVAACWTGGFIDMGTTNVVRLVQGVGAAPIAGALQVATRPGPGWADEHGSFADPRPAGFAQQGFGKLPDSWVHYGGLYRHEHESVLTYTVGPCAVRELPGFQPAGGVALFTRTIEMASSAAAARLLLAEVGGAVGSISAAGTQALLEGSVAGGGLVTVAALSALPPGAALHAETGRLVLELPPRAAPIRFVVCLASLPRSGLEAFAAAVASLPPAGDLALRCAGSAPRWPSVTTSGRKGEDRWAYTVDTLELPKRNPWKSWIRPTGVDVFADGRLAICTLAGDVWVASGVDDGLSALVWKRYASGLFEPMGLRIVKDVVYVLARDQIVRLVDLNGSGEAGFYQSFNNDATVWPKYNDFAFDLQTDRAGNFYYARGGHGSPVGTSLHACIVKVSPDGRTSTVIANGLRAPNGMGMGPMDELSISDNQGNWIPSSRINLVRPGGWYGFVGNPSFYGKAEPPLPAHQDAPLCWIPMSLDNSSGGEVWAPPAWGPLGGRMLHTSYGMSSLMAVIYEVVDGVPQGGVVPLPLHFSSGIMRGRFSPSDGQLYVCGLKGWQTNAGADGCLERVRWTRQAACLPIALNVTAGALTIGFSAPLERSSVVNDNFSIQAYGYRWSGAYGSDDYLASDPKRKGRDTIEVQQATLSPDGRTITLHIAGLAPVMQMEIKGKLRGADGTAVPLMIANTINVIPKP